MLNLQKVIRDFKFTLCFGITLEGYKDWEGKRNSCLPACFVHPHPATLDDFITGIVK